MDLFFYDEWVQLVVVVVDGDVFHYVDLVGFGVDFDDVDVCVEGL